MTQKTRLKLIHDESFDKKNIVSLTFCVLN